MRTKNIILIASLVLFVCVVSCKKDHEIPTGKVFNSEIGGDTITPIGGDTLAPGGDTIVPGGDTIVPGGGSHDYVDLGLPSGTLWATCNVGADTPEDYGVYFAWGETRPKSIYNYSTYKYCNGSENTLTKYCSDSNYGFNGYTDTLTTLLPADDAATVNWGADWRIPTEDEWRELYQKTTNTWTLQNGVVGRLFTASNGNSLFLPAAGYYIGGGLYYTSANAYYWSSSLVIVNSNYAWSFQFERLNWGISNFHRDEGQSVRAVRVARKAIQ